MQNIDQKQIAGAIIIAGIFIAGAILLKDSNAGTIPNPSAGGNGVPITTLAPIKAEEMVMGNPEAKVALVLYEDYQCPFCGKFFNESELKIRDTYVKDGTVKLVYRDFPFLGTESTRAAEAARCAGDSGKYWEYHDYLFTHQNGENQGHFSDQNLNSFAKELGLHTAGFERCLYQEIYATDVADSKEEAGRAGVNSTPQGFIVKNGKVVDTIDGAVPYATVKAKLDAALK